MQSASCLQFNLQIPPSLNSVYVTDWKTKRRFLSKRAHSFKSYVINFLRTLKYKTFKSDIELNLLFHFKDDRRRDLSNHVKILEDALVESRVIIDDSKIDVLVLERGDADKGNPHVEVTIIGNTK